MLDGDAWDADVMDRDAQDAEVLDGGARDAEVLDAEILDAGSGLRAETLELWVEQGDHFCLSL